MSRLTTLALVLSIAVASPFAPPASAAPGGRWARQSTADPEIVARVDHAERELLAGKAALDSASSEKVTLIGFPANELVGTWLVQVYDGEEPIFRALQTFHNDRTFTETSDLLGALTEGPAHGVWWGFQSTFFLTFQLFAFEDGVPVGMIRVRNLLEIDGPDHLSSYSVIDFIDNDGVEAPAIATGTYTGVKLRALHVER